ncbi:MAG: TRAP transporter substrate-binding protein DctP [Hyphomicrobiaceae bacterium]|nr:TRAP transporter substrate-binding protein DctP [Hyphomicrobiaceae bacterium]
MPEMIDRRRLMVGGAALTMPLMLPIGRRAMAGSSMVLRLSSANSPTDQRALAMIEVFAPAVAQFADLQLHWNATLFKQGTEIEAMARGNLEMAMISAQELAEFVPEFSIFTSGYLLRDAEHQSNVFAADYMAPLKQKVEDDLGVKLLAAFYLGRRQLNLRSDKEIKTPADLAGIKLRMPGTDAWQFLGRALGANPVPMAFTEVYTALQTGAIDGQDNPLPTIKDARFFEATKQIVLTGHLVDQTYLAISKKAFTKFSPEQQAMLQKAASDTADRVRVRQLQLEEALAAEFKNAGLKVYAPDVDAFRAHVQKAYLASDYAKGWPDGLVDKINATK